MCLRKSLIVIARFPPLVMSSLQLGRSKILHGPLRARADERTR
jgi:hypothetical protein